MAASKLFFYSTSFRQWKLPIHIYAYVYTLHFQASGSCADPFFSKFQLLMGSHEGAQGHMRVHLPRWGDLRAPWSMQRWFLWKVHNTFPHAIWPQGVGGYDIYSRRCMHTVCMYMVCKFYENSENCIQKRCVQNSHDQPLSIPIDFLWFSMVLCYLVCVFVDFR